MNAKQFNKLYPVGSHFIYQSVQTVQVGLPVKTCDIARDFKCGVIVEIDRVPFFVNVKYLTPAG